MAASAEMGCPSWGLPENGRSSHVSPILVAPAEFSPFDGTQEQPSQEDSQSVTSSLSCPTRGWVSAAGSVMDDAVMAIDGRSRGCHLCFNTGHFLMECPLLGSDVRQAAHKQRDLKYPKGPSDRLGFQGQKQLPPFSDPLKSEGRQGLYSLSVDGRSERKEGILEDSMG